MAELTTVARPYAKAAFRYATEKNAQSKWSAMLGLSAALIADDAMVSFLGDPQLTAEEITKVFSTVCGEQLDDAGQNLIAQLAQNKRLATLPEIYILFELYLAEQNQAIDVDVVSAFELSDSDVAKIKALLSKRLNKEINVDTTTDTTLIGGVIIKAGDLVIDSSIKGKLSKLTRALI